MAYQVFISSTRDDLEVARDVARRLKDAGVRVFPVEKSAILGANILSKFKKNLHEADEVLVLLTGKSVRQPGIISEMGAAHSLNKRVTPVLVNVGPEELPKFLAKGSVSFADLPDFIKKLSKRASQQDPSSSSGGSSG